MHNQPTLPLWEEVETPPTGMRTDTDTLPLYGEVDWADLREMARAAGWSYRHETADITSAQTWGRLDSGRVDAESGWARVLLRGLYVSLFAPGPFPKQSQLLTDPSPSDVLDTARQLGLIGDTDD